MTTTPTDYRQFAPFFTSRVTMYGPGKAITSYPHYPRHIADNSIESMVGEFKFQLSPANRHSMAGGSKVRAYRIARGRIIYNRSYLGQYYAIFAGPKGILP